MHKAFIYLLISCLSINLVAHEAKQVYSSFTFIENKGQWTEAVKFKAEINGASIYFKRNAFHFQFQEYPEHPRSSSNLNKRKENKQVFKGHNFDAIFIGSNKNVEFKQEGESDFYYNYFIGNNTSKWRAHVKKFKSITYENIYDGINLRAYQHNGFLKYDYQLSSGSNPNQIKVHYQGVERPIIENGRLVITHSLGQVIEQKPYAYQVIDGKKVEVPCIFYFDESDYLGFAFPEGYNQSIDLIIDPELLFSTYSGSISDNFGMTATYDNKGNGYMGGIVYGTRYDTTIGAFQTTFAGGRIDISISKFYTEGDSLIYSTYLGGDEVETIHSMVVNENEELYILGATSSTNFPFTQDAYDTTKTNSSTINTDVSHQFRGGADIVISKFDRKGENLLGSTFFGGNETDGINYNPGVGSDIDLVFNYGDSHRGEIVLDSLGNCYIGTSTNSSNLSSINTLSAKQDGLIAKFTPNLDSLIWSRYLGGSEQDAIYSLKVIDNNRVLVGGGTQSTNFPITVGSYQDTIPGGRSDGFISIISADGLSVDRSTFIGTSNYDQVYFIEFDRFNNVYGLGQSKGGLFPIKNSTIADSSAGQFIIKLDQNLDSAIFSMTFGDGANNGLINISPTAFLVDRCQNIFASGWGGSLELAPDGGKTLTSNMPISADAYSSTTDNKDFYLYAINRFADSLIYASYFGDPNAEDHVDGGTSRFDKDGIIYQSVCASCRGRNSFPIKNAYASLNGSTNCNNALFKLDFQVLPVADFSTSEDTFCLNEANMDTVAVLITNLSSRADRIIWDFYGTQVNSNFKDTTIFITQSGSYTIQEVVEDTVCQTDDKKVTTLFARPDNIEIITSQDTTICYKDSARIGAFTNGFANFFTWSKNNDFSTPFLSNDSLITVPLDSGINVFYVRARNNITEACEKFDSIEVNYIPVLASATISEDTICENASIDLIASLQNVDRFIWNLDNGRIDSVNSSLFETYTIPGKYKIQLEVENLLCPTKDTIELPLEVTENTLRFENLKDTTLCGSQGFSVSKNTFGTAENYLWSTTINFSDTLNSNPKDSTFFIPQADSAEYFIKISNQYCERIDSLNAEYIEYELALDPLIDSTCSPFTTQLQTTIIGTDSFRIFFGNGNSTRTDSTPTISYANEGIYSIKIVGSNDKCNRRDTITETIQVFQNVQLSTPTDTTICLGDTITLKGNTFGTATVFLWDTSRNFNQVINPFNDSTILVSPPQGSITYYFKGENVICDAIDSVEVSTELLEIELEDLISLCLEDTITIEARIINSLSNLNFSWSPADSILSGQGTSTITAAPLQDMTFYLNTTSNIGCTDFDSSEIDVNIPAFTSAEILSTLDSLFKGQTTQLTTNRNGSNLVYLWEPDSGLSNVNSPSPTLKAIESKTYKVTITDLNTGCVVVAFKRIKVFEVNCGDPDIFIPSAFTPNQDLSNDVLYVRGSNVKSIDFQLYNRWGEKVFETKDINVGWDGTYKGREVDPGVFVYSLKAVCFDDQEYFTKGDVTLIR